MTEREQEQIDLFELDLIDQGEAELSKNLGHPFEIDRHRKAESSEGQEAIRKDKEELKKIEQAKREGV